MAEFIDETDMIRLHNDRMRRAIDNSGHLVGRDEVERAESMVEDTIEILRLNLPMTFLEYHAILVQMQSERRNSERKI